MNTSCKSDVVKDEQNNSIVMLMSSLDNPFFLELSLFAEVEATKKGLNLHILDSENDSDLEYKNFKSFDMEDIDVLILNPTDSEKSSDIVELANEFDIPVITIDRGVIRGEVVSHITSDNYLGGVIAGEYLENILNSTGDIMLLEGILGTSANEDRINGIKEALKETAIKVVYQDTAEFNREVAYELIMNNKELLDEINAVFAANDEMALGVLDAVLELDRQVIIVGFDGNKDAINAVINGYLAGTVAQQPDLMATQCIKVVESVLHNETVEEIIHVKLKMISVGFHN